VASPAAPTSGGTSTVSGRVAVLGDSLAVSPSASQNFVSELQARLTAAHPGWTIFNGGVSGDTTVDGLARVDQLLTPDTKVLVLELGANDGLRAFDVASIERNLDSIIERARARSADVLLCGMETPPLNGLSYSLQFHAVYPRVASRYQIPLVPFLLAGVALNPDLNGDDEIHPNAAGARVIAATVWPYLDPLVAAASVR
jgi:acyl-CoA thioesterase-1